MTRGLLAIFVAMPWILKLPKTLTPHDSSLIDIADGIVHSVASVPCPLTA
jgi:hypothetical protein